jgi:hypothetical protein
LVDTLARPAAYPRQIGPDEDAITHALDPIGEVEVLFSRE